MPDFPGKENLPTYKLGTSMVCQKVSGSDMTIVTMRSNISHGLKDVAGMTATSHMETMKTIPKCAGRHRHQM